MTEPKSLFEAFDENNFKVECIMNWICRKISLKDNNRLKKKKEN